jgi:hypothetical protein
MLFKFHLFFIHFIKRIFIMTSIKLALAAALLALSTVSAQADTGSPNILASVATNAVETLSDADASKTRGEYRKCYFTQCYYQVSSKKLSTYNKWYKSRNYLGSFKTYGFWGKRYYVAR